MSDAILHVDDTPNSTAADARGDAEHTDLELDRVTVGMLAASEALTKPRDAFIAKFGALRPGRDLRTPPLATAPAIGRMVRHYMSGESQAGAAARRLLVPATVITAVLLAVAWRGRRT